MRKRPILSEITLIDQRILSIFYDICSTREIRSGDRVAEGARLESGCALQRVPGVRIPPTPRTHWVMEQFSKGLVNFRAEIS